MKKVEEQRSRKSGKTRREAMKYEDQQSRRRSDKRSDKVGGVVK
jgi:hypothetical protein